ncbi:uncharacterized protein LOC110605147 [Manihot esculenta]|uniref:Uncharacterized protein n=1 Tax=Manihot esculenta TaxID=3983 RepID=A0A2C9U6Y0_MANES|nr:uncharacterized protein LOC110605147 [Manihot esculenta]OAY25746.1 hypothetical protein MANES_17G116700v8 [Manihot esculenta]
MMMDIWSWISELPDLADWTDSDSPYIFELATSKALGDARSIQLRAERTAGSSLEALVTFTVSLQGFHPHNAPKTLWVSDTCPLNSEKPFFPLILQLLQEIIIRSPMAQNTTCPRSQLQNIKPEPISWIMESHSPESFSSFFNLVFLMRLFWLCVCDAPSEVGSLYFESLLGPNLEALRCEQAPVLRTFLVTVGVDAELCFMRTLGYMLTKWLILREVGVGLHVLAPMLGQQVKFSYAMEAHGFWVLKGYAPILSMPLTKSSSNNKFPAMEARDSVLKYTLAHQQLEAIMQLEYSISFHDGYIRVKARVDNLRLHVVKLGFKKNDDVDYSEERHFVSRARVWVGPEVGATYVVGMSLGRSTDNGEREVEMQRAVKGNYEESRAPKVKTRARTTTRTKMKNWRWDQDAEGNSVIFDAVLYNNTTGHEVATWKMGNNNDMGDGKSSGARNRYTGPKRPFTKTRGLVFAGDEYGEGVEWRLSKEMEGSVLKWRIGGQVWVSYWPNEVQSSYFETRCVEWCDEVDLPLITGK